jgi:hypothetical protein
MAAGGSAQARAEELMAQAAQARAAADALETEAGAWAAGADGERRVADSLAQLPPGWHVHHDRLLRPGRGQTNLDHVVVGPSGVYLVDTKNWAGGTSVHDGNLWQHTQSSSPKGRELDNVSRFAAEMERGLGLPVVPVIALAGSRASSFPRQRVRGVEIIPRDELVGWLVAQPAAPSGDGVELLARRVAHAHPPASLDATHSADATPLTVPDVLGAEPVRPAFAGRSTWRGVDRTPNGTPRRRHRRRRGSMVTALFGLVVLMAVSQLGPGVVPHLLGPAPGPSLSSAPGSSSTTPVTDAKQCLALSRATIVRVSGSKTVLEKPQPDVDTCTWWLMKPRFATQTPDVWVQTGAAARRRFAASGTTGSRVDMLPGEVSAWLPENTALAGWASKARTSQPFLITLRFRYPEGANQKTALAAEAAAEKKVSRLAEELAIALARRGRS